MNRSQKFVKDYCYNRADKIARICSRSKEVLEIQQILSEQMFESMLDTMVKVFDSAYDQALTDCMNLEINYPNTESNNERTPNNV